MRASVAIAVSALVLVGACKSKTKAEIDIPYKGRIYAGMAFDEVKKVMGEPDRVGSGRRGCHYARKLRYQPGSNTIEWAWNQPGQVLVVYFKNDVVKRVGTVKP